MPIARYFSQPCPACRYVEDNFVPTIEDRYELNKYDLRDNQDNDHVILWSSITNKIPTIQVEGNEQNMWFIGVDGVRELYDMCINWDGTDIKKRKIQEPIPEGASNVDFGEKDIFNLEGVRKVSLEREISLKQEVIL